MENENAGEPISDEISKSPFATLLRWQFSNNHPLFNVK